MGLKQKTRQLRGPGMYHGTEDKMIHAATPREPLGPGDLRYYNQVETNEQVQKAREAASGEENMGFVKSGGRLWRRE